VGNAAEAEDVTAAVLLQVIRAADKLPDEPSLAPWLDHLIANAALAPRRERASCDP
jgi:DNA-directed RNA polymerase specialized sigma24 family protein